MHCFQLVFQLTFYLVSKFTIHFNWYPKYKTSDFHWYLKILFIYKWYLKICFVDLREFKKFCFKVISNFFWYELPIIKGSLTSLLYIDSCWVYRILKSLTSLLYVVHVYKGRLTSPLIHCILYFMWVRVLSSLLHIMNVCRGS